MGSQPTTHPTARLQHAALGSWRKMSLTVRSQLQGRCFMNHALTLYVTMHRSRLVDCAACCSAAVGESIESNELASGLPAPQRRFTLTSNHFSVRDWSKVGHLE